MFYHIQIVKDISYLTISISFVEAYRCTLELEVYLTITAAWNDEINRN